jgi:hypothetical protein
MISIPLPENEASASSSMVGVDVCTCCSGGSVSDVMFSVEEDVEREEDEEDDEDTEEEDNGNTAGEEAEERLSSLDVTAPEADVCAAGRTAPVSLRAEEADETAPLPVMLSAPLPVNVPTCPRKGAVGEDANRASTIMAQAVRNMPAILRKSEKFMFVYFHVIIAFPEVFLTCGYQLFIVFAKRFKMFLNIHFVFTGFDGSFVRGAVHHGCFWGRECFRLIAKFVDMQEENKDHEKLLFLFFPPSI